MNRDEGFSLDVFRVFKRIRFYFVDFRAEGVFDFVENKEDSVVDYILVNGNVDLEYFIKFFLENIDNGVGVVVVFFFKSIDFFVDFIVILVIITFCV